MSEMRWPLFITLTVPNSTDPESLRKLRADWSKFRRRKLIRDKIIGGVATFEITNCGNGWHPHLHAIADCRWLALHVKEPHKTDSPETREEKLHLAKQELSTLWADQIKSPFGIVQAKRVPRDAPGFYVLKYAAKCSDLLACEQDIAPMLRVLRKTRTLSGWGSLHPLPSPDVDTGQAVSCKHCGSTKSILPDSVISYITRTDTFCDPRPALPAQSVRDLEKHRNKNRQ